MKFICLKKMEEKGKKRREYSGSLFLPEKRD
jgi:hypothetical protein